MAADAEQIAVKTDKVAVKIESTILVFLLALGMLAMLMATDGIQDKRGVSI